MLTSEGADQMGLGKTVMMIATMIANRATQENEPKCTLIVCSPALMTQCKLFSALCIGQLRAMADFS